jgi:hypothetical protein
METTPINALFGNDNINIRTTRALPAIDSLSVRRPVQFEEYWFGEPTSPKRRMQ